MKMLFIIITFYLISGLVNCSDVIGVPGGRVIIYFQYSETSQLSTVYFCKVNPQTGCDYLITAQASEFLRYVHRDRFVLLYASDYIILIFRNLSLQDTGMYQCGLIQRWNQFINLKVKSDACCVGTRTVQSYSGQSATISCSYPAEFETNTKSFYKLDGLYEAELIRTYETEQHRNGRFSISNNKGKKVFSVSISDVREEDKGVYFCGVINGGNAIIHVSLFTVIQLQVAAEVTRPTAENPNGTSDTSKPSSFVIIIIIPVVVCVLLLMGVGFALIFYRQRRQKSQGSLSKSVMESLPEIPYYDEIKDQRPQSDTDGTAYYCTIPLSTMSSDPPNTVYATAKLPTMPSDPPNMVYATAQLPSTIPSDPPNTVYATAQLPTTIHSDPPNTVYATAQLPTTIPSDPPNTVYATAQLPTTIPSDPPNTVYATAQLPTTIPSDPPNTVYATAQLLTTIPSDPPNTVYATAQLPTTIPSDPPDMVCTTAQLPTIPSDLPNKSSQVSLFV